MSLAWSRMRRVLPALIAVAVAVAAGCSSDNWSEVGGSLPTDISQDSLKIELPPIFPVLAEVLTPLDTIPAIEREALYIGSRPAGAWRGTPLLRFDVGDPDVQARLPIDWQDIETLTLNIVPMVQPNSVAVTRDVRAFNLATPLSPDDLLATDVTQLFGDELASAIWNKGEDGVVDLPADSVQAWLEAGTHNGIALFHEAPAAPDSVYSNFAGYGGENFSRTSRLWNDAFGGRPAMSFRFRTEPETNNFSVPLLDDLTHFERDLPGAGDLQIGSYFERRLWIDFDLGPDLVPVDATINSGTLILQVRQDLTMQVRGFSRVGTNAAAIIDMQIRAWESARSEAGDKPGVVEAWGRGNREVLDAREAFNPDSGTKTDDADQLTELRIDVTEYVQRQVNEIVPDDLPAGTAVAEVGLLLAFVIEQFDLDLGVFYGLDATDDLKPRLEVTYTPPADSWQ